MNSISTFIDKNLENNGVHALQEIQALRDVIENNPWHTNQSVFDHTKAVVESLKKYTDKELLFLAALFHDIAKPLTFSNVDKNGNTLCVGHEKQGSVMVDAIGPRIGLFGDDLHYVKYVVENHDQPHELVNTLLENEHDQEAIHKYFTHTGIIAHDLLLHALADMEGSNLFDNNSDLFAKRKAILEKLLKN